MLAKSSIMNDVIATSDQASQQQSAENHPVIRTLYDHADEITTLGIFDRSCFLIKRKFIFKIKF